MGGCFRNSGWAGVQPPSPPPPRRVGHFGVGGLVPKAPEEKSTLFCFWGSGWQGGWGPTVLPTPPWGRVGHFWVPGFSKTLGGWVSQVPPPFRRVAKKPWRAHTCDSRKW